MEKLTTMDIYMLCNKNQWFTCGTNSQYEKMFEYVREAEIDSLCLRNNEKIEKLAVMIWICSDDNFTIDGICHEIRKHFAESHGCYFFCV